jgi:hypothetical protein
MRCSHTIACEITMIAPASERAPRMLLLICEDEQGLPMEVIRPEPSLRRLQAALRGWLAGILPDRVCYALGLLRPIAADPRSARGYLLLSSMVSALDPRRPPLRGASALRRATSAELF